MEEVLELSGGTAFNDKQRKRRGGIEQPIGLLHTTADCWLEWQKYRQHEQEIEALDAVLIRRETSVVLESSLLRGTIEFNLQNEEDYSAFLQALDTIREFRLRQQTAPETLNKMLTSVLSWLELTGYSLTLEQPPQAALM